jgi:hypothetical protein
LHEGRHLAGVPAHPQSDLSLNLFRQVFR